MPKFPKGSQEAKDYMASIRKKRQPKKKKEEKCSCGEGIEGGSLSTADFKGLIEASYDPKIKQVGDYVLDKDLSSKTTKVFDNVNTDQAVVAHKGTEGVLDWANNAVFALGGKDAYKKTARFKEAQKVQKRAEKKYGAKNVSTIGHSQGGLQAEILGKHSKEIITLNKATRPFSTKKSKNQTDVRTERDVVSALNPFEKKSSKDIVIESKSYNPLTEHSTDVLGRLDKNQQIGEEDLSMEGQGIKPNATYVVQSVVFPDSKYDVKSAKQWLKKHRYKSPKVDIQPNTLRFRQLSPKKVEDKGFTEFRNKMLGDSGIALVLAYKKKIIGKGARSSKVSPNNPPLAEVAPAILQAQPENDVVGRVGPVIEPALAQQDSVMGFAQRAEPVLMAKAKQPETLIMKRLNNKIRTLRGKLDVLRDIINDQERLRFHNETAHQEANDLIRQIIELQNQYLDLDLVNEYQTAERQNDERARGMASSEKGAGIMKINRPQKKIIGMGGRASKVSPIPPLAEVAPAILQAEPENDMIGRVGAVIEPALAERDRIVGFVQTAEPVNVMAKPVLKETEEMKQLKKRIMELRKRLEYVRGLVFNNTTQEMANTLQNQINELSNQYIDLDLINEYQTAEIQNDEKARAMGAGVKRKFAKGSKEAKDYMKRLRDMRKK